jgi:GntR family transcriptional regulator, transcriptional repressor for pyruvate dehydrogenase complex
MVAETGESKFQAILKEIHYLIEKDGLRPGDRLPSERELSERLGVGRSSVREVLRSLELLGLISTRRGEGTFLEPYHSHHLVNLLAAYILRDVKSKRDLVEMRILLESGAIHLAVQRATDGEIRQLTHLAERIGIAMREGGEVAVAVYDFHAFLIRMAKNDLLTRIWVPITQYEQTLNSGGYPEVSEAAANVYRCIAEAVANRDERLAVKQLEKLLYRQAVS